MIESIILSEVATYKDKAHLDKLKKVNVIFGGNGSGKTPISRIIANPEKYSTCSLGWQSNRALKPRVYNRDFIDANFRLDDPLKGVLTLGEDTIETKDKIKALQDLKIQKELLDSKIKANLEKLKTKN